MSKPDDYLWDGSGPADPDVQRLEKLLAPLAHDRPLDELRLRRPRRRAPWIAAIAAAVVAAAILVLVLRPRTSDPCSGESGFAFRAQGGTVGCGDGQVARGVLPIGGTLDTGGASAVLSIANIGAAELAPNTRVQLERSETQRHQLHLDYGKMHAKVSAPPRVFAVTTPSTGVTDLGCEYTIEIDAKGKGSIEVQDGRVELETAAGVVIVAPAGTSARLLEGRRPTVPYATKAASPDLRAALAAYESGGAGALDRVLQLARVEDAITLVNLAYLVPQRGPERERVLVRLGELHPPPNGVSPHDAYLDPALLDAWREDIVLEYVVEALEK